MVTTPPYLASAQWYAEWFRAVSGGASDAEGCDIADRVLGIEGKDFSRTTVSSREGVMTLSVAVAGGAGKLRHLADPGCARLSLHGNWPHAHLGALEAEYGRAPYYGALRDELQEIYTSLPDNLGELNRRLHSVVISWLTPCHSPMTPEAVSRGRELMAGIRKDLSVIDLLMRYGPETTLILIVLGGSEAIWDGAGGKRP